MKLIVVALALAIGLLSASPARAQEDATYSCGAYGAGAYSNNDCVAEDAGGNNGAADAGGDSTGGETGSPGGSSDSGDKTDTEPKDEVAEGNKNTESGMFAVLFAKLATSWGWLLFFGLLLVAGAVIIGVARRRKNQQL